MANLNGATSLQLRVRAETHGVRAMGWMFSGSACALRKLTKRRLKRGVFCSIVELQPTVNRFLVGHDHEPKPFKRTADPDKIFAARRGRQMSDSIHQPYVES